MKARVLARPPPPPLSVSLLSAIKRPLFLLSVTTLLALLLSVLQHTLDILYSVSIQLWIQLSSFYQSASSSR